MKHFKVISICLVTLFLSVAITSYSSTSVSSNNQAFATLANNNIDETIKKSCPTYQSNNPNNIKGLVTDILKACIPQSNLPPTSPNPNPNPGPLDQNILEVQASAANEDHSVTATITEEITQNQVV